MTDREQLIEQARGADILDAALRLGAELKRAGSEHAGPCPAGCSSHDGFAVNTRKRIFVCRRGGAGGDVIAMVQHCKGLDFEAAVEWLTSEPMPLSRSALHERHGARSGARAKAQEEDEERYRARQIEIARGIWAKGLAFAGSLAEAYLAARGIDFSDALSLPLLERVLRFSPNQPYWRPEDFAKAEARPVHTGPAMLAAVTDPAGDIVGVHITWIDPERPGAKVRLPDPDKPDELLPAKKLRGTKRKGAIRLIDPTILPGSALLEDGGPLRSSSAKRGSPPTRLVIGEGIETVLSVYDAERASCPIALSGSALHERDGDPYIVDQSCYWSAIDLGHLGGKAAGQVSHPTLRTDKGKPLRVGNHVSLPQPDRDLDVPDSITEIILLGDGDSDRFITERTLRRAAARWARPSSSDAIGQQTIQGRTIKVAWAPDGMDFNDVLRGAA